MTRLLRGGQLMAVLGEEGWETENVPLRQVLNNLRAETAVSGASPDPEFDVAQTAADALGPLWTVEKDDLPPFDPDVVY